MMDDAASSCAIDGLTIFCKRFLPGTDAYGDIFQDEVDVLYQSIMDGEASRSDLEKTSNMSTLWACLSKVATNLKLQEQCDLENHDFSNLSEDVSRFLGAFISSVEVIIDSSSPNGTNSNDNIAKVIGALESIFVPTNQQNPNRKADLIVQLMRDYKDWFNYSYMFNRRVGKHPKPSFEIVNRYYQSRQHGNISNDTSNSTPALESDDDTYKYDEDDDTLGDSFAHENFPAISTPNVAPLNPFSAETYDLPPMSNTSRDSTQSSMDNHLLDHEHGSNNIPFAPDEASIINSYYSNWSNMVEEDEDSDADPAFFVARKANKRMTRMKSSGRDQSSSAAAAVIHGGKKKTKKLTRRRSDSDPPDNLTHDRSTSRIGKSVTFADEHNLQLNSSEEFDRKLTMLSDSADEDLDAAKQTDVSPPKKDAGSKGRFIFSSVEVTSSNDMVQGFDSNDDVSPPKYNRSNPPSAPSSGLIQSKGDNNQRGRSNSDSSLDLSDMERSRKVSTRNADAHIIERSDRSHLRPTDTWSSGSNVHENHASTHKVIHSKLSDGESDDDEKLPTTYNHRAVNATNNNSGNNWGIVNKHDPWANSQQQTRRYRNPLDATLEEEEFKAKKQEALDPDNSSRNIQIRRDEFERSFSRDQNIKTMQLVGHSVESVDPRSSTDKTGILSPPVKIPSIHASPHRYAKIDLGSDSETSPHPSSASSFSMVLIQSPSCADPARQKTLDRLKQNFLKMKEAKKLNNGNLQGKVSREYLDHSPSISQPRKDSLSLQIDNNMANEGIYSPHLSPSKVRGNARRSSPGSRSSLSSPHAISAPVRKSDFVENRSPTKRMHKEMPTKLVLDKRPAQQINKEVFEIMGGRRQRPTRPMLTAHPVPAELRSSVSLLSSSSGPPAKYAPLSLELPHLQPQSSFIVDQKSTVSHSSGHVLHRLAETVHNVFDRPFQEIPPNADFPELSEVAIQTGVIMEGFLRKRSSIVGLWQKKYFILKESEVCFCELQIFGSAVDSAWGTIPLRFKTSIPICNIDSAFAVGSKAAGGKDFVIKFISKEPTRSSSFTFFGKKTTSQSNLPQDAGSGSDDGAKDHDSASDTGSVASHQHYGTNIQQITLQADSPELRLFWVTMINKALAAARDEME